MKAHIILFLIFFWITITGARAAQRQPPTDDVSARVFNSAGISVPQLNPGQWQSLTFDSERWDTRQLHETSKNSGRLKAPIAGKYYVFAHITWQSPIGAGLWGLRLQLNGNTVIAEQSVPNPATPSGISMSIGTVYALVPGDYIEAQVFQNNGGTLLIRQIPATSPEFGMARIP